MEKEKPRFDPDIDTYPDETMRIMKRMAKISAASAIDLRRGARRSSARLRTTLFALTAMLTEPSYRKLREQESPLSVLDDADGRSRESHSLLSSLSSLLFSISAQGALLALTAKQRSTQH